MRRALIFASVALVASLMAGLGFERLVRHVSHDHLSLDEIRPAFDVEVARAAAIGIDETLEEGEEEADHREALAFERTRALEAGACLAFVAAVSEPMAEFHLERLLIVDAASGDELARSADQPAGSGDGSLQRHVTQVQLCVGEPRSVRVEARLTPASVPHVPIVMRYRILGASPDRAVSGRALDRARLSEALRRELGRAEAAASPEPAPLGAPIAPPIVIAPSAARLVPPSPATAAALASAHVHRSRRAPPRFRVDLSLPAPLAERARPVEGVGEDGELPMLAGGEGEAPRRVLAVIDIGDLGAPCVGIRFTRRTLRYAPPAIESWSPPGEPANPTLTSDGHRTEGRVCPARGLGVYTVPNGEHAEYTLELFALDADVPAPAPRRGAPTGGTPSTYAGALDELPEVVDAAARCEGDEAAGCLRLAHLHARIQVPETRARERDRAYARACQLGSAEGCLRAAFVADPPAMAPLERACELGEGRGCALAAEQLRLGRGASADYPRARGLYERGCELGEALACQHLANMRRYLLGGGEL